MSKRSCSETPEEKFAEAISPMGFAEVCGALAQTSQIIYSILVNDLQYIIYTSADSLPKEHDGGGIDPERAGKLILKGVAVHILGHLPPQILL